jgi:hypothetical protein
MKEFEGHCSDFLFARPSFTGGVSRILDLGGTLKTYNYPVNGEEADSLAMAQDWKSIGIGLRKKKSRR